MKKFFPVILNLIPRQQLIRFSFLFTRLIAFAYKGDKHECPVCGGRFRKLLPYGYNRVRPNALCPKCLSLERHRLIWLFLRHKTDFFTGKHKVLHIAPEQCFHKKFRKMKNLEYITADMDSPLGDVKLDVQDIPFPENTFDIVFCNHVLEHVEDDKKALREIHRVLKPDGYAILHVPIDFTMETTYEDTSITDPREREKHFLQYDHLRLYGQDFPQQVTNEGFVIKDKNYLEQLTTEQKKFHCLPEKEYMYAFHKA